jgi:prepilin-type N-terminal cleavage/methylation domain-containing protein
MRNAHKGYTLLELIVSVGIFSVVMLAATAAYLSLISLDRQARATTDVVTNLSFALDSMAREIRAGKLYACNDSSTVVNCGYAQYGTNPGNSFSFTDGRASPRRVVYSVNTNNQLVAALTPVSGGPTVTYPITDSRIRIDKLNFYVKGVGTTGGEAAVQPQVLFVISGVMQVSPTEQTSFSIQSSATQRLLELNAS